MNSNLKIISTSEIVNDSQENSLQTRAKIALSKPCFGFPLTEAVKAIALFDTAIALSWIIYIGVNFSEWKTETSTSVMLGFWGCYLTKMAMTIFLAILLFHAASSRGARKCKLWIFIASLLFGIWLSTFIVHLCVFTSSLQATVTILFFAFSLYRPYTLIVVHTFIQEIKLLGDIDDSSSRGLTNREVQEFMHGNSVLALKANNAASKSEHQPYNKEFEISMDELNLDTENPLQKGEFGLVLKGNLKLSDGSSTLVAVKITTPDADLAYFKAILTELKVMTYVASEKHEHIINLLGACTSDIRNRNLFVIVEFSPFGNLQQYLKNRRGFYVNLVKNGDIYRDYTVKHYCNVHTLVNNDLITTFDLLRWSYEITEGLKYLASKGVIHADLAAKNIFLTDDKVAKISNFGLSRQLYLYSTYVSPEENPLPWRWLALESLRDMNFSTQSDIWSLGVTIWEIFSLGATPFSGMSWTSDFVGYISRGLRMNKSPYAMDDVYKLMLECWDNNPLQRPSLDTISNFFEVILRKYNILDCMKDIKVLKSKDNDYTSISTISSIVPSPCGSC